MFSPNKKCFIFIVFTVMCSGSESFWLHTEKSLTAVRGRNISLPCYFSVPADAVYWYKHDYTGAPDDEALLVARDYRGVTDPVPGFERFSTTKNYSLIIRNITVHDETTFSCLVKDIDTERGYTDLRVIALAEPLEPIIESCNVTAPGRCIYTVDENSPENITLSCGVNDVRPPPDLTWITSDGRVPENATHKTPEKDGLFNISSQIQVSKSNFYYHYTCQAKGEAVKGTSSMMSTLIEDDVTTVSHDLGRNGSLITSVAFNVVLLMLVACLVSCLIYKKYGFPGQSRTVKLPEPVSYDGLESQSLTEQEAVNLPEPEPRDHLQSQPLMVHEAVNLQEPGQLDNTQSQALMEQEEPEPLFDNLEAQPLMEQEAVNLQEPGQLDNTQSQALMEQEEPEPLFDNLEAQPLMEQEAPVNLPEPEPRDHLEAQPLIEQKAPVNLPEPEPRDHLETQPLMEQEGISGDSLEIMIQSFNGKVFPLRVNENTTLDNLKRIVSGKTHVQPSLIHITFNGRILSGLSNLKNAGVNNLSTLVVYGRLRGGLIGY